MKKRLIILFSILSIIVMTSTIVFFLVSILLFDLSDANLVISITMFSFSSLLTLTTFFISYFLIIKKREVIGKDLDFNLEQKLSTIGIGSFIFNDAGDIIWASKFLEEKFGKNLIGKKFLNFSSSFSKHYLNGESEFVFNINSFSFRAYIDNISKLIVFQDVSKESMLLEQYEAEQLVIGELEIDNFAALQTSWSNDEIFELQTKAISILDDLVLKYNLIYKHYSNGRFSFFTNREVLSKLEKRSFSFVSEMRKLKIKEGFSSSISIGIGFGASDLKALNKLAREGLKQSQSRGGDQVSLIHPYLKPKYFGKATKAKMQLSKVKIRQLASFFDSALSSKEIENIIIYGHKNADLDALGASLGIYEIAKAYGKNAYIQNISFDETTKNAWIKLPQKIKNIFIKPSKANSISSKKSTLAVLVDVAELSRIENDKLLNHVDKNNVFIFDHHRNFNIIEHIKESNVYIDTKASSAAEIIVELISFMENKIDFSKETAQMLLNGIFLDTINFTKGTSSRTYEAASFLEMNGASSMDAANSLKLPAEIQEEVTKIIANIEEVKPGYFLSIYDHEVREDVVSIAAEEILRVSDRKASFVIAKVQGNQYKLSARSIDINIQKIVEYLGGGGHFGAAAVKTSESLEVFSDNVRQAIASQKEEI